MNPSLAEYHVPVHMDVPEIEMIWTDIPDPHAPEGARGIGEIGITGVAAAVANAVYNATGTRPRPADHARQAALKVDRPLRNANRTNDAEHHGERGRFRPPLT